LKKILSYGKLFPNFFWKIIFGIKKKTPHPMLHLCKLNKFVKCLHIQIKIMSHQNFQSQN